MKKFKFNKENIIIILGPILLAIFLYIILIPLNYILIGLVSVYAFIILFSIAIKKIPKDDMEKAWNFAVHWWEKFRKEDLSTYNARGFLRYFGDDKYIAFIVNRGKYSGSKSYLPLVIVVKPGSPEIADWDDAPRGEKLINPFIDISPRFIGGPSPSIKPELEPALRKKIISEKKEKEKEEEEIE